MMLFNPTRIAVNNMENGMNVQKATNKALNEMTQVYGHFDGALICLSSKGEYAAAKNMKRPFHFVYRDKHLKQAKTMQI